MAATNLFSEMWGYVESFSPLFIGSMAATARNVGAAPVFADVSVPYSSGQWLQRDHSKSVPDMLKAFQSPIHRVNGCN